jgi:hypothetical protein
VFAADNASNSVNQRFPPGPICPAENEEGRLAYQAAFKRFHSNGN